jgi:DNA-binding transcriptional regulator YhcF (GntR family)
VVLKNVYTIVVSGLYKGLLPKVYTFLIIANTLLVVLILFIIFVVMKKFVVLTDKKDRVEFEYLYVWNDKYECVDARYVNISSSRETALYNYRVYVWKVWYLNTDCTEEELVKDGLKLIRSTMKTNGTFLLDSDVYKVCNDVFFGGFNAELFSKVKELKKIEWKNNVDELIKLTEEEEIMLNSLEGKEYIKEYNELIRIKKIKESSKCLNKMKMNKVKSEIINSIVSIKEENKICSISDISLITGISYKTVKKHYEEYMNEMLVKGYDLVIDKNECLRNEKTDLMIRAIMILKEKGLKVTKSSVSEYSGVSRLTVNKRWDELKKAAQ